MKTNTNTLKSLFVMTIILVVISLHSVFCVEENKEMMNELNQIDVPSNLANNHFNNHFNNNFANNNFVGNEVIPKSNGNAFDANKKNIESSSDANRVMILSEESVCKEDIKRLCGRSQISMNNNFAVLACIQNDHRTEDINLSKGCHHLIWTFKRNLTHDDRFADLAKNICHRLIGANPDCLKSQFEKVLSPSANLLSCLIEKLEPETDIECKSFLNKMELIIFSDYRLIHKFTDFCSDDIEKLKCGRLDTDSKAIHTQGETIECLEKSMDKLSVKCKHQILRIAELQSDDFHLDRSLYFSCRDDREKFCPRVQSGEGRVYRCLMRHKLEQELSSDCREKLFQREMLAVHDYKVAPGLAKACRNDIRTYHCREETSDQKEIRLAQILLCLEDALTKNLPVAGECRTEMLSHRKSLLENYNLTPDLVSACQSDIQSLCNRMELGGKTLHCLMNHAKRPRRRGAKKRITEECRNALDDLLKEANVAEDWRVDPVLQQSCQLAVDRFCKDVHPGDGRVLSCLMDHIDSNHMNEECREAMLQIQYFVARDFNLDATLYRSCHEDAEKYCHAKKDWFDKPGHMDPERGPSVLSCLYRYAYHPKEEVRLNRQCLFDIHRVMKQRAISVDLHPEIEEPCLEDLARFCSEDESNLQRGSEMECLQDNYEHLAPKCQNAIGNYTEEENEHLELNYPLFKACDAALKDVCAEILERDIDQGDLIECLILNKNKQGVKKHPKCRVAIEHHQLLSLKDFRFSFKFKEACKSDVLAHCSKVKTKYQVVECLSTIIYNDTMLNRHRFRVSPECKNQLRFELLQRSENIKMDPNLENACEKDRQHFCSNINPGESQIIECLKSNVHKLLSRGCQKLLFKMEKIEMNDNSVDYSLLTACKSAIGKFCAKSELKEVLFCLRDHRDSMGMEQRCRSLIFKRLAEQNTDYRLNPRLKSACQRDIPKFCGEIVTESRKNDEQLEGKVIACLKKQYVLNKLSQSCEIEVVNVIREVAENIELDPILYKDCQNVIKEQCSEDFNVQECLKMKFQSRKINDEKCKKQVAQLINEVKADIQSDPLLYKVCIQDLKHYCADIPSGHGRQLSCLLAAQESSSMLSEECKTILTKRIEMFEYAAQVAPAESVAEVVKMMANSPSRNYFLFVAFSIITVFFAGGLLCGRVTKRITTSDKIK